MIRFTETELATISNCLRVAAEQFKKDVLALCIDDTTPAGVVRLGQQVNRQAEAAEKLYDRISLEMGIQT